MRIPSSSMPFAGLLLLFCGPLLHAADPFPAVPKYEVQKASPFHERDGIDRVIQKLDNAKDGAEVRVAYLGGSITAANGWRPKTTAWMKKTWPKATIKEINAAIGGTGSDLGVFRLEQDVLRHDPDLLFVEFAVNDGGASPENIWRGMEGIVRQTWKKNPETDIVFVYTIAQNFVDDLKEGRCSRSMSAMEQLADFYGIPSINFGVSVVELLKEDKLVFKTDEKEIPGKIVFSGDGVHPHDAGHEIYAKSLIGSFAASHLEDTSLLKLSKRKDHAAKLAKTFIADNWEAAKLVPITEAMLTGTWEKLGDDNHLKRAFGGRLGGTVWHSGTPGSKLSFKFKGTQVKIYDLLGPDGGQVRITVDGVARDKPVPRFDSYCTYHRLATLGIASDLDPDKEHTVVVEIDPEQPDRHPVAFRLKDPEKELAEPKYRGTNVWFGQLMLIGDLVP